VACSNIGKLLHDLYFFISTVDAFSFSLTSIWCEVQRVYMIFFFHGSMLTYYLMMV